jgi:hypothetical protein
MTLYQYHQPIRTVFTLSNMPSTPTNTAASQGTSVTTGATPHEATAWTEIFTAAQVTSDIHELFLAIVDSAAAATQTDAMIDLAVGEAGSEVAFLTNYLAGWNPNGASPSQDDDRMRIHVRKGQRISFRARSLQTSKAINVVLSVLGYDRKPDDCFRGIDVLGGNAAASQGTSVTPGNSGAWGNWASIGSATSRVYHGVKPLVQGTLTNTTTASAAYYFQIGASSAVLANQPRWRFSATTAELVMGPNPNAFHRVSVPIGTQLQMRGTGSTTANTFDCAILAGYF